jgi:RNA polymerase subunit RPABC4/transcription elongation factor Spt4
VDRVYLMHGDPRLAPGLQPAASDPTWYDLFDGTPLPASLPFLRVQRRAAHPDEGPCPDFPGLVDHIPVFSRGAVEALAKLLTPNGELVPLTCNDCDREMLAYNVTRVVDALDPARADVAPGDGKQARDVRSYTFRSQALAETSIFKLPETALKHVYVTEPFVDRVLEEGLQGFVFELMWVADEAPMLCPYCLGIMHEGTAQCPSCGLETTRDALIRMGLDERDALAKKLCAFCGTEIPEPADPCPYCGEGAHRHGPDTGVAIV